MRTQMTCAEVVNSEGSTTVRLTPAASGGNRWNEALFGPDHIEDNASELVIGPLQGNHADQFVEGKQYFVDVLPAD